MASSANDDEEISGINVTPLVDVVLVLLVIVMVAASFEVSRSIPLSLPEAGTGETTAGPLVLSLDASGRWYLDGEAIEPAGVPTGRVANVDVLRSSSPAFGAACRDVLRRSQWEPPLDRDGSAVATVVQYRCQFEIR